MLDWMKLSLQTGAGNCVFCICEMEDDGYNLIKGMPALTFGR